MLKSQIRIAIVDDDSSVRKALARLLTTRAFETQTFASAREFLESLEGNRPDCLILDHQMPGMTGLELQLQLARQQIRIPTVVITALEETELSERCLSAGAAAVLNKPLDIKELLGAITTALEQSAS
jgi:FixJ family two-component response regulator